MTEQAATAADLSTKTLRLYEARGRLATRPRTATDYRLYTDADIARLRFIAAARELARARSSGGQHAGDRRRRA